MKISKSSTSTKIEETVNYDSIVNFIVYAIDILTVMRGEECKPLTKSMKLFYAASIIHYNSGITNPISNSALQIYKKYYKDNINKLIISNYLRKISSRKWIAYDKEDKTIDIHPLFKKIDLKNLSFSFNILLNNNETDR